ncbi:MAG: NYN domain-containing protein [Candidatus Xenobia bacterium]
MSRSSRRERWNQKREALRQEKETRQADGKPASEKPAAEPTPPPAPPVQAPVPVEPPMPRPAAVEKRSTSTACYVDYENVFFGASEHGQNPSVVRIVRHLNRLSREASGVGWSHTAVYANWDAMITQARHAQDDWAMLGWRTIAVPTREDYMSRRTIKNLCDFVMSLDMLEDARDRGYDHFFIVSGDADFCEVAERLKRLRRKVTVVSLRPNLSFRLREAADDYIVWGLDEISGDEQLPVTSYRRLAQPAATAPGALPSEDPYQVLRRAVRLAERDQGMVPVSWRVIRDEYFLKMVRMSETEADRFTRELARAGFATLVYRRLRDGSQQAYLSLPR